MGTGAPVRRPDPACGPDAGFTHNWDVKYSQKGSHVQGAKTYRATHRLPSGGAVMFSEWDFNSWIFSIGLMLFMLSLLTGFGAFVSALMSRTWGEGRDDAATARMSRTPKEPSIRKAA